MVGQVGSKIFSTRTGREGGAYVNANSLTIGSGIPSPLTTSKIIIPPMTVASLSGCLYGRFDDTTYYTA
jgi:hypothetical protein